MENEPLKKFFWYKRHGFWTRAEREESADGPFFRLVGRKQWPSYEQAYALSKMMRCCYRLTSDAAYHPIQDDD